jgi:hypothetical protein
VHCERILRISKERSRIEAVAPPGAEPTTAVIEHPHLLRTQAAFTLTGPKRKVDELAEGLRAEELATMRAERAVMMSPL